VDIHGKFGDVRLGSFTTWVIGHTTVHVRFAPKATVGHQTMIRRLVPKPDRRLITPAEQVS
jgi:hypothetical protein